MTAPSTRHPRSPLLKDMDRIAVRVTLGDSLGQIAEEYGVKPATVRDYLRRSGFIVPKRRDLRPHGTRNRYDQGCRCMACRAANTRQTRLDRRARRGRTPPTHGASTYGNWGCRCLTCRTAHAERMKMRHQARKAR